MLDNPVFVDSSLKRAQSILQFDADNCQSEFVGDRKSLHELLLQIVEREGPVTSRLGRNAVVGRLASADTTLTGI